MRQIGKQRAEQIGIWNVIRAESYSCRHRSCLLHEDRKGSLVDVVQYKVPLNDAWVLLGMMHTIQVDIKTTRAMSDATPWLRDSWAGLNC